ncbi:MAG: DUF4827 family protein [Bacteroidales bacterium]
MKRITYLCSVLMMGAVAVFTSCDDNKTYAQKLDDEKDAIKKFIAEQKITFTSVSENALLKYQADAANWSEGTTHFELDKWYKFEDGLYMRINRFGDTTQMYSKINNPNIVIRFDSCYNLLTYDNPSSPFTSNEDTYQAWLLTAWRPGYPSKFGTGLDFPIRYLGQKGNVSLIVPSKLGMAVDQQEVIPYYYKTVSYMPSYQ